MLGGKRVSTDRQWTLTREPYAFTNLGRNVSERDALMVSHPWHPVHLRRLECARRQGIHLSPGSVAEKLIAFVLDHSKLGPPSTIMLLLLVATDSSSRRTLARSSSGPTGRLRMVKKYARGESDP